MWIYNDGCPDVTPVSSLSDADSDGVIDSLDDCKYQPEIYNLFQDTDGCPDIISDDYSFTATKYQPIDNDNDGVDDRWDQCLNESENYNGFADNDGCPDVIGAEPTIVPITDSDNDGYIDELDSCPSEPETWNKYNDLDGCPDSLP
jgi:hypothetical protein